MTKRDYLVDDPESREYNQLVTIPSRSAQHAGKVLEVGRKDEAR